MTTGIGTSAAQGCPAGLAWGGNHGDDAGEYSTAAGTTKALAGVVCISPSPSGWSCLSSGIPWRHSGANVGGPCAEAAVPRSRHVWDHPRGCGVEHRDAAGELPAALSQ
jgi:hypothetical protein